MGDYKVIVNQGRKVGQRFQFRGRMWVVAELLPTNLIKIRPYDLGDFAVDFWEYISEWLMARKTYNWVAVFAILSFWGLVVQLLLAALRSHFGVGS